MSDFYANVSMGNLGHNSKNKTTNIQQRNIITNALILFKNTTPRLLNRAFVKQHFTCSLVKSVLKASFMFNLPRMVFPFSVSTSSSTKIYYTFSSTISTQSKLNDKTYNK
ncbi:hypothetical protein ACJX0J_035124, partial [Zea mays]